jgi:hypothetical protein
MTPLAIPDSLPATLVTPCLTLSFTSSMAGAAENLNFFNVHFIVTITNIVAFRMTWEIIICHSMPADGQQKLRNFSKNQKMKIFSDYLKMILVFLHLFIIKQFFSNNLEETRPPVKVVRGNFMLVTTLCSGL